MSLKEHEYIRQTLERYTNCALDEFCDHILITNSKRYLMRFQEKTKGRLCEGNFRIVNAKDINCSMIDFGIGSPQAALAINCLDDKVSQAQVNELKRLEREHGFTVALIPVARREEAAGAFRDAPPPGLLLLPACPLGAGQIEEILALATQKKVPTISLHPPRGGSAAMLSLYPDPAEQGRLLCEQVVQILKGAAPAAPLLSPKKIELEVNLPLAKQLGARTPMALLESATKIIK